MVDRAVCVSSLDDCPELNARIPTIVDRVLWHAIHDMTHAVLAGDVASFIWDNSTNDLTAPASVFLYGPCATTAVLVGLCERLQTELRCVKLALLNDKSVRLYSYAMRRAVHITLLPGVLTAAAVIKVQPMQHLQVGFCNNNVLITPDALDAIASKLTRFTCLPSAPAYRCAYFAWRNGYDTPGVLPRDVFQNGSIEELLVQRHKLRTLEHSDQDGLRQALDAVCVVDDVAQLNALLS